MVCTTERIPSRLFAGNIAQVLVSFAVFGIGLVILHGTVIELEAAVAGASDAISTSTNGTEATACSALYNASNCFYPKDEGECFLNMADKKFHNLTVSLTQAF